MKSLQPGRQIVKLFTDSFRQHVHLLIAWGLEGAFEQIAHTDQEEHITTFLFDSIDSLLHSQRERWFKHYDVHNERPVSSSERVGHARREIDLLIKLVSHPSRPEYVFEAKPLNYTKSYQREGNYIGSSGLQRFLSGDYSEFTARYPEVGMLGYVLTDSIEQWRDRLKSAIVKDKVNLELITSQQDLEVISQIACEWFSEHLRRNSTRKIRVCHILLTCR